MKIVNPTAVFSGLDKITGRIISFDVAINETVQFGALQVTPRVCYTRPPTETPNTDAFIEVDEVTLQGEVKRIFTGWMFAASPGLHGGRAPDLRRLADRLQRRHAGGRRCPAGARRRRTRRSAARAAQQPARRRVRSRERQRRAAATSPPPPAAAACSRRQSARDRAARARSPAAARSAAECRTADRRRPEQPLRSERLASI